ncbi:hypothetical protein LTR37_012619 [Vermiconidia calcicola]|uniref:Uncharacterized protein n=1 Tax=Vermiconidia calcicola TaxID=1690605 RepID=A0ACC3MZB1_9PEZI|nr:hypothetical protein LTR37_012619 [Vermiconidia calcicola]
MKSPSNGNLLSPAKLLALPAELRQLILYHVHGDDEIAHCAFDETAQRLASVCRTFKDDVAYVFRLWTQRKKELLVVRSGVFDSYMTELMAPLLSASRLLSRTQRLAGIAKRKQSRAADNNAQRMRHKRSTAVSTYDRQRRSGVYDNGRLWVFKKWITQTREEVEDTEMWRKRRESRIKALAHEKKRDEREARLELKTAKALDVHDDNARSNTCLKRTVHVYTQDSSTYVVTNIGSTSLLATPSFCSNVSVSTSTVYRSNEVIRTTLPGSTVTVYQQPTPSPQEPGGYEPGATNNGFEEGSTDYVSVGSSPEITAEVAQSGPLSPYSGNSYLLITFNNSASSLPRVRRQALEPQVYNVTQNFNASAGSTYALSAYAAQAPNGETSPICSITICVGQSCGSKTRLTTSYSRYSYQYTALSSDSSAIATFSIECDLSAYVALDDLTVLTSDAGTGGGPSSPAPATVTRYITRMQTVQQSQNQVAVQTRTTTIDGSVFTLTATTTIEASRPAAITNTGSTLLISTAIEVRILFTHCFQKLSYLLTDG